MDVPEQEMTLIPTSSNPFCPKQSRTHPAFQSHSAMRLGFASRNA